MGSIRTLKRQIKKIVYSLRSQCLARLQDAEQCDITAALNAEPLMVPSGQASLVHEALHNLRGTYADDNFAYTSASSQGVSASTVAKVRRMQGHAGTRQVRARKEIKPIKEQI